MFFTYVYVYFSIEVYQPWLNCLDIYFILVEYFLVQDSSFLITRNLLREKISYPRRKKKETAHY